MAGAVVVNGVLCHCYDCIAWDVACNLVMIAYVNRTTRCQPCTAILTVVAAVAFAMSTRQPHDLASNLLHVVGVQMVLCACLCMYQNKGKRG